MDSAPTQYRLEPGGKSQISSLFFISQATFGNSVYHSNKKKTNIVQLLRYILFDKDFRKRSEMILFLIFTRGQSNGCPCGGSCKTSLPQTGALTAFPGLAHIPGIFTVPLVEVSSV